MNVLTWQSWTEPANKNETETLNGYVDLLNSIYSLRRPDHKVKYRISTTIFQIILLNLRTVAYYYCDHNAHDSYSIVHNFLSFEIMQYSLYKYADCRPYNKEVSLDLDHWDIADK